MDTRDPKSPLLQLASIIPDGLKRWIRNLTLQQNTSMPEPSRSSRIGRCHILNFIGSASESEVSIQDEQLAHLNVQFLRKMFEAHGFEVFAYDKLNTCETLQLLEDESKFDHSNFDKFVIYIIANCSFKVKNGFSKQAFYCKEDENQSEDKIKFERLFSFMKDENCKSLAGKPKLIFIQHMGEALKINLERLSIELPIADYAPALENSYLVRRLGLYMHRYSGWEHLVSILNKVMADLNFYQLTTILQSTLPGLVFFNQNAILNYQKLKFHLQALKKLSPSNVPMRKFVLLDYQNCTQNKLDEIMNNFEKYHFKLNYFRNLNLAQTRNLLREESKIIKYDGTSIYSSVIFCVFADCNNQGFTCQGNELVGLREIIGSILEPDEKLFLDEVYVEREEFRPLKPVSESASTFFVINDTRMDTEDMTHKPICFISSNSNAYLSMNTYPTVNLKLDGTGLQNKILRLSMNNDLRKQIDNETVMSQTLLPRLTITKGKCIVLSFNLLEWHHLRKAEDIAQDVALLETTFGHLGFHVESYKNFTVKQFTSLIEQELSSEYSSNQCLVLCLITHFENGWFHCVDKQVNFKSALNQIYKSSTSLSDIAKIIVVKNPYESRQYQQEENTNLRPSEIDHFHYILPDQITISENFVILNCSLRNEGNCEFIKILCQTLKEYFYKLDLMTIMRFVTLRMNEIYQDVHLKSTVTKILFFEIENKSNQTSALMPTTTTVERSLKNLKIKLLVRGETVFYRKSNGKCVIIKCIDPKEPTNNSNCEHNNSQVSEQQIGLLGEAFEKLNFDVHVSIEE